jgi:6-phosphogluconolactonase
MKIVSVILSLIAGVLTQIASAAESAPGPWQPLFDGQTTAGWRSYRKAEFPQRSWVVEDGCLHLLPRSQGGDIITTGTFEDFEFEWEWRIAPQANSGIKYLVTEARPNAPGPEYQMVDDATMQSPRRQTASFYEVLPPQTKTTVNPPGQWNSSRLLIHGNHVEHWLNGVRVLAYELGSAEVKAGKARSKFKDEPGFGEKIKGHILLTDHNGESWFRNLRIRELPAVASCESRVYFGTGTGGKSQGIYVARFDPATGRLTEPELAVETRGPTFLALHPVWPLLYAVGEYPAAEGRRGGGVSAFAISPTNRQLTLLNQQSSGGSGPCHLAVEGQGKYVLVANYAGGSLASLPIQTDGSLGEAASTIQLTGSSVHPQRQTKPYGHFITMDPANRFALACDLGTDKVLVYRLDEKTGALTPNATAFATVPPGAGPRHLAFSPSGKFIYVVNEMGSTITAFAYDPLRGALSELQTISTLPEDFAGRASNTCAEVEVHPSGKFVYASNRGHDSIAVFAVDAATGKLTAVEQQSTQGRVPRHFKLDPTGRWLLAANQATDAITVFAVDAATGRLKATGQSVAVPAPMCVLFVTGP